MPRWTIRLRLTVLYGAVFLVTGAALLAVTYTLLAHRLRADLYFISSGSRAGAGVSGGVVSATPPDVGVAIQRSGTVGPVISFNGPPGHGPDPFSVLQSLNASAVQSRANALHQLLIGSGIALGLLVIASTVLGWMLAGRALQPVRAMTTAARDLSEHNLHERLPTRGPDDELGALATTFNGVLERLEAAFDSQRRFVANASHELRTPLTLERAVIEVALADPDASVDSLRATCERVLAIGAQQDALIDALLTLARSQRGLERREPVDLTGVAADAVDRIRPSADAHLIAVDADLAPAETIGDAPLLARLVTNLLDNAVRHNSDGGWVEVRTGLVDGKPALTVANGGPVVPPAEIERLLLPFQRMGTERTDAAGGAGLGLSIVAAIVSAHDASLTVTSRTGGGLRVVVRLPNRPDPSHPR